MPPPTPASHSCAPMSSRTCLETPLRPGAKTCAAHRAAFVGPSASATCTGDPAATSKSATRISAHLRTAARKTSRDGNRTPGTTVAMCLDEIDAEAPLAAARGGVSSTQLGARPL